MIYRKIKKFFKALGPGVVTGGSDNDPAGIVTYTTAGALFGYSVLWVMIAITPFMIVLQEMAARIAIVKRHGLTHIIKENYGLKTASITVLILAIANIATISADLAGVAAVLGLLAGRHFFYFLVPVTLLILSIIAFEDYRHIRRLLLLLTFSLLLYVFSAIMARPDWSLVVKGFVPVFENSLAYVGVIVGIIGTTISPYMLFWQASEEIEEHHRVLRPKYLFIDTASGMFWSNFIAIFIIIASSVVFFSNGVLIDSVETAALALRPVAGDWAYFLFSIGIIASGLLTLPVLAGSTAYAVTEIFNWQEGFRRHLRLARGFYCVIGLSMIIGTLIAFLPINPVAFLYYTQILNGFLTPFLILILLLISNNKKIMGEYVNGPIKNTIAIISFFILISLDVFLFLDFFKLL